MNYLWHVPLAVSTKGNFASYWLDNNADTQHFPMPGGEGQSQKFIILIITLYTPNSFLTGYSK